MSYTGVEFYRCTSAASCVLEGLVTWRVTTEGDGFKGARWTDLTYHFDEWSASGTVNWSLPITFGSICYSYEGTCVNQNREVSATLSSLRARDGDDDILFAHFVLDDVVGQGRDVKSHFQAWTYISAAHRPPGAPLRTPRPGDLIHVDVKKLGNIPDGGGWRVHGRARGERNSRRSTRTRKNNHPVIGYSYLHTALDDHSRLAYTEILTDERKETAVAFWHRAHAWFTAHDITVRRLITDNGACYKSFLWRDTLTAAGISVKKTRPFRPQTNGKVERFHRTLADEWAYAKAYSSETARRAALPTWLHAYNHHRHHTALGGPPASGVPNLTGQNS